MKFSALSSLAVATVCLAPALPSHAQTAELAEAPLPAAPVAAHPGAPADPSGVMVVEAPAPARPRRLHLMDWTLLGAAAALRTLDFTSTEKGLEYPQSLHEGNLPTALVRNKPGFAGFEAGAVVLNYGAYHLLVRHNLRSLARISQYMYVGVMTGQVAKNYQLIGEVSGRPRNP